MARRRSGNQFQTPQEATVWAILVAPIAAASEDLEEAAEEADDLLLLWRERRRDLDDLEEERLGEGENG